MNSPIKVLLYAGLALSALAHREAFAAAPVLNVPASDTTLRIAINLPPGSSADSSRAWELVEKDGLGPAVPVDLVLGPDLDGTRSESPHLLVASIPPENRAANVRQFRLLQAQAGQDSGRSGFDFRDLDGKSLGLWEGQRPVFVYNFGVLSKPGVPSDRNRSTYLHPIYGLDGEVLTEDFPRDHYHHRGLFWAWPHVGIGGTNYDLWDLRGIHQRFERWLDRRPGRAAAVLGVQNGWYIGDKKVVQERVWFRVYPAAPDGQVIDAEFTWIPTGDPITLAGAEEKSYGGLTLRFAPRTGTTITTPLGDTSEDLAMTRLAWADLSAQFAGTRQPSGAAIFISPDHPDYPPTWLTRHYGALCVGWPGVKPAVFQAGEKIHCQYRVWLHRGRPGGAELKRAYASYELVRKVAWASGEE